MKCFFPAAVTTFAPPDNLLPQMLSGCRNVRHVFIQDVLLGADAVVFDVLGPVQLTHVKVKRLKSEETKRFLYKYQSQPLGGAMSSILVLQNISRFLKNISFYFFESESCSSGIKIKRNLNLNINPQTLDSLITSADNSEKNESPSLVQFYLTFNVMVSKSFQL